MPIRFACPKCKATYTVADTDVGKKSDCAVCGQRLQVPSSLPAKTILGQEVPPSVRPTSPSLPAKAPPVPKVLSTPAPVPTKWEAEYRYPSRPKARLKRFVGFASVSLLVVIVGVRSLAYVVNKSQEIKLLAVAGTNPPADSDDSNDPKSKNGAGQNSDVLPIARRDVLSGEEVYRRLVQSSVLLISRTGFGSGFVAHKSKGLIITNAHVVEDETDIVVIFPRYKAFGDLITDPDKYDTKHGIKGKVIDIDVRRDLAVVQVTGIPSQAKAVVLAPKIAETGSTVYSVGGSGADANLLWRLTKGIVRGRAERKTEIQTGTVVCTVLETDAPINPGDSGGPVMNDRGELVGVVSHFVRFQRQVSGNIDLVEVQTVLRRNLANR